ncbi:S-adenosyl-L-methionine-dependent methyltransferase [Dendryphion nanum]|uniref:S-adenosyl-L-methionine-dependent methyltransferase n=1 Tax=Dendryphion nanum TaxID=256645 RepID=A0A9P9DSY6_9PLEO|nr:S-adenosyl-L-methionine-dependent methyltransferase [Dendryphion nanum]
MSAPQADGDSAFEIDPNIDEGSSIIDFTDELESFTTSLTPSVKQYPYEHGRRYHAFKPGKYPLPNDEPELDRLDLVHRMIKKVLGGRLFLAPTTDFHSTLDLGTGTGIWTMEMGDTYPGSEFLGNDLSPVQPTWTPPNVKFEVDDIESEWAFGLEPRFDFIFARGLAFAVSDFPKLLQQAHANLRPGGWIEFQDFNVEWYSKDGTHTPDSDAAKFIQLLVDAARKAGKEPSPGPKLEQWIKDAGFQSVVHQRFKIPVGPWPRDQHQKETGLFNLSQALDGLEAYSLRLLTTELGWQPEEVKVLCAKVRSDLKSKACHRITDFHVVYAQKP